jgi:hypothetical protein
MRNSIQLMRNCWKKMFSHHRTRNDPDIMPKVFLGLGVQNTFLQRALDFSRKQRTRLKLKWVIVSRGISR